MNMYDIACAIITNYSQKQLDNLKEEDDAIIANAEALHQVALENLKASHDTFYNLLKLLQDEN